MSATESSCWKYSVLSLLGALIFFTLLFFLSGGASGQPSDVDSRIREHNESVHRSEVVRLLDRQVRLLEAICENQRSRGSQEGVMQSCP